MWKSVSYSGYCYVKQRGILVGYELISPWSLEELKIKLPLSSLSLVWHVVWEFFVTFHLVSICVWLLMVPSNSIKP